MPFISRNSLLTEVQVHSSPLLCKCFRDEDTRKINDFAILMIIACNHMYIEKIIMPCNQDCNDSKSSSSNSCNRNSSENNYYNTIMTIRVAVIIMIVMMTW